MSQGTEGFQPDKWLRARVAESRKQDNRQAITRASESFIDMLEADGYADDSDEEDADDVLAPALYTRRVVLRKGQRVDVEKVLILYRLFNAEQVMLTSAQKLAISEHVDGGDDMLEIQQPQANGNEESSEGKEADDPAKSVVVLRGVENGLRQ
jgi:hypothetical protein